MVAVLRVGVERPDFEKKFGLNPGGNSCLKLQFDASHFPFRKEKHSPNSTAFFSVAGVSFPDFVLGELALLVPGVLPGLFRGLGVLFLRVPPGEILPPPGVRFPPPGVLLPDGLPRPGDLALGEAGLEDTKL